MIQNFLLELEGVAAGRFFDMSGGSIKADVITMAQGSGTNLPKHIGQIQYEDIVMKCGTGMARGFYDWVGTSFTNVVRKNGAVVALDHTGKPMTRIEFKQALINSLQLPALDGSSKEAAVMKVKLSPEITMLSEAEKSQKPGVYAAALPKAWKISDFKLTIEGLEADCNHITYIEPLGLTNVLATESVGSSRFVETHVTKTTYSDLVFRIPSTKSKAFQTWFKDFVVNGNSGSGSERRGVLEYFAPTSKQAYFQIELKGIGIYSFAARSPNAGLDTVSMYCEEMKFLAGPAAVV